METTVVRAGLHYAADGNLAEVLARHRGHVLGYIGFGAKTSCEVRQLPFVETGMATVDGERIHELWLSRDPVRFERSGRIAAARNDEVLFGCIEIPPGPTDYDVLVFDDYCRVFDYLDAAGYPNLLRAWHYLPDIHGEEHALERYKRFSLGRHEAFVSRGRAVSRDAPAASAVGMQHTGSTVIAFLAALRPGLPIENPRQVSAYSYPAQYGPRGPTFSRALFANWNDTPQLYVSGTASIFGHLSRHAGDVAAQTDETLLNLRAVLGEASGLIEADAGAAMRFKVYLRDPGYRPLVEQKLRAAFGSQAQTVWLRADICRRELLLEIELVVHAR